MRAAVAPGVSGLLLSEDDLLDWVIPLAMHYEWRVVHQRPAKTARGWRTLIQGHKGFPDLVLAKSGRVLFRELKSDKGKLSVDQILWEVALGDQFAVWRPRDRLAIMAELRS